MLHISKPRGWSHKAGQFVFLNAPAVSWFQWHPFSIASPPNSPTITLLIQRSGDWTGKLIDTLFDAKRSQINTDGCTPAQVKELVSITDQFDDIDFKINLS